MVRHLNIYMNDQDFLDVKALKAFFDASNGKEVSWARFMLLLRDFIVKWQQGTIEDMIKEAEQRIKPELREDFRRKADLILSEAMHL